MSETRKRSIMQFLRFGVVGAVNTLVDLGVFNLLIFVFGIAHGFEFIAFKSTSFAAAVANSYFMNKYLVFKIHEVNPEERMPVHWEAGLFFAISVLGLLINVIVSYGVFVLGAYLFSGFPSYAFANLGAVAGSAAVMLWNFFGYKFFVFKR